MDRASQISILILLDQWFLTEGENEILGGHESELIIIGKRKEMEIDASLL